ncbi:MAG: Ig-like domain-containing protein [Gemmatimonadales bacterium]
MIRRTAPSRGVLTGASKGLTWTLTTAAAVFALLANARNLGLADWLGGAGLGFADHATQRVLVTPRAETLFAVGDTALLAAIVTDRVGAVLAGARLRWETQDSGVVTVDSSGAVVARGPGRTLVTAWVRDHSSSALVSVTPRAMRIIIPGDSALRIRQGDTLQLAAVALDARGHRIAGSAPSWRSADPTLVTVDSFGTAIGVGAGLTRLRAVAGESTAELSVRVDLAPTGLLLAGGAGQRVAAGHRLPESIVLRAHAALGQPVPGIVVRFSLPEGEGQVEPDSAITDREGRVSVNWSLGPQAGLQRLTAQVAQLDSVVSVTADADPTPGNVRLELADGDSTGTVGLAPSAPIRVRLTDSSGIALEGVPVRWTVLDGGSVIAEARTDSLGVASARWSFGPRAGRQRLLAQVGHHRTIPALRINGYAIAGDPVAITLEGGQGQHGVVGRPLVSEVVLTVRDRHGNPVAGVTLIPKPATGSGSADSLVTDLRGHGALRWTLGTSAGTQSLRVTAEAVDSALWVRASASPGAPVRITIRELPAKKSAVITGQRLQASVVDAYGNPVRGVILAISASSGRLASSRVRSDDSGRAAISWQPGKSAAEQRLTVRLVGGKIQATHALHPVPSAPVATATPKRRS